MKAYKEPIRYAWIWITIVILALVGVPWYLPLGTVNPIILGLPYWAFISFLASIALGLFLNYVVRHCWDMESLKEEEGLKGGEK